MAEYLIQDSTLSAIADAIRAKTGKTDAIPVPDMPGEIAGITVDSGASEDVRYVTFLSYDGTVEYGKKAVAVGDDCADPIARGVFDTPTRESDVQYSYTFAGWATEVNGGLDADALKEVSEDRTVYANFIAAVRYYTIYFYDTDGTTLLTTKSVAYGSVPSYTPTKSGYDFVGWEPELAAVTGEASYCAQWTEKVSFSTASWARIAEIAEAGEAENYFAVGDTKTITLNFSGATETMTIRIVGFNHDDLTDGSGKAGISILCAKGLANSAIEVAENTTYGTGYIWETSQTRTVLNSGAVYQALPEELRAVLKSVTKISNAGYNKDYGGREKNTLYTTDDKVWLPSAVEVGISDYGTSYVAAGQGEVYEYYATDAVTRRMMTTTAGVNKIFATRSMYCQYSNSCVTWMGIDGSAYYGRLGYATTDCCGRAFGFCV